MFGPLDDLFVLASAPAHVVAPACSEISVARNDQLAFKQRIRNMLMANMPKPEIKATATSEHSVELIDAALSNPETPLEQREYLLDLKRRKYN